MSKFRTTLIKLTFLFILTSCGRQSGVIEFNNTKIGGLYELAENGKEYKFYNSEESFKLDTTTFISFADFDKFFREESDHEKIYSLGFRLNDVGILKFKEMTERNVGKPLCFVIGNKIMAAPIVQVSIPNGQGSITVADKSALEGMIDYLEN
jgi:preprotein translocase subunit SecD